MIATGAQCAGTSFHTARFLREAIEADRGG
jgi:hypothetical protein